MSIHLNPAPAQAGGSPAVSSGRDRRRRRRARPLQQGADGTEGIVLVHSLAMDRLFWQPVAERLARSQPVLTYDCRGHGGSDKPAGPYTSGRVVAAGRENPALVRRSPRYSPSR
jgi:pimeloyl-ACP methyl ester carboxylesterase